MTSRRSLLQGCLAGFALPAAARSRVVVAKDPAAGQSAPKLAALLDRSLQAYFDRDTPAEAWKRVARPGESVGLKVNCLSGRGGSTRVALVDAIVERLRQAGVRNIVIWDRLTRDMESAGFPIRQGNGLRTLGNEVLGYAGELSIYGSAGSLLAKNLTEACDAVINLPVLKDHGIVGVTMALKNLFGAIHNPNKYHVTAGDPYVADVYMLPPIRQKVRLTICDAIAAQYEGGPTYMPQWTWPHHALMVAEDPVALDHTGWRIIERKRAEMGMQPLAALQREPKYIATAARYGIGTNDPRRIEVKEA